MQLEGKTVAITGAAQGLGLSMAKAFASKGARIALIDINADTLGSAADQCRAIGVDAQAYTVDISDEVAVVALFEAIARDFNGLNGLINNAGITKDALLLKVEDGKVSKKMSLAAWQAVIDVNLTGSFLCGREAATQMIEHACEGLIINISSISKAGNFGQSNYSAAKAGVAAMATSWAKELSRHNIRAAAIAPGFIATDMVASMDQSALEKLSAGIPMKRLGLPEEIAQLAVSVFENDYLNGRVIEIDGGLRL